MIDKKKLKEAIEAEVCEGIVECIEYDITTNNLFEIIEKAIDYQNDTIAKQKKLLKEVFELISLNDPHYDDMAWHKLNDYFKQT